MRGTFNFLGRFTNDPFADFLLGALNDSTLGVGRNPSYMFMSNYGFWAQDDIKVRHDLTFNIGMRYEIQTPPYEKYGRMTNFVPSLNMLIVSSPQTVPNFNQVIAAAGLTPYVGLASNYGLPQSLVYTNYKDFAPRFGFAWRPYGNRTVLRGGYGIFYSSSLLNPLINSLTTDYPFALSETFTRTATNAAALTLSNPFPPNKTKISSATNSDGYDIHAPAQYLQSWNLTFERELGSGAVLEIGYVGSKGTHLGINYNINQPLRTAAGTSPRPYPEFTNIPFFSFGSDSIYNAGMVTFRKRFSRGLFYRLNYVYGKSLDDNSQIKGSSDGGISGIQNVNCRRCERGRSDWDAGHTVTMSFMYEVPLHNRLVRGWQLAGSGQMHTGQPFTPQTSNVNLNAGEANRPDRLGKGNLANPTPNMWFNLNAFPVVPLGAYRFGDSGRNILDGPGFIGVNIALMKKFYIRERSYFQFRVESFNVLNHPNYFLPNNNVDVPGGGAITQADDGRVFQFALKYMF